MDIHRSRFVPYPTSAISALAFSRSSDSGYTGPLPALKLALGRANGNVEIWNPQNGAWVQETVYPGDNRSIDGLVWTQDPDEVDVEGKRIPGQQRLFSIASSPSVTEWDLEKGVRKRESTGNFSEAWCFAAQPRYKQQSAEERAPAQEIVAGCGDGTLVLMSTEDNDLQFKRFIARVGGKKGRCMCVAYQDRERIAAGFADSVIRIYDTRAGHLMRQMSLGVGLPGMPKNAMVWQVKCLPNGDIVTADSNGEVRFWDGKHYNLTQRLAGHDADCLDLVTSADGRTVFSGSIDGKLAIYRQSTRRDGRKAWARSTHRRVHTGEVKAMAAFDSRAMSVVVSGGGDVAPMVTPLREYGRENARSLPTVPQDPPVVSAPKARLMASWWGRTISVWRIATQGPVGDAGMLEKPRKLVAKLALDTNDQIRCVAISTDGRLIAAATSTEVKVFQLKRRPESDSLAVRRLGVPSDLATAGARSIGFSPDGKWFVVATPDNEVHIARLIAERDNPKRMQILSEVVELERRSRKAAVPSSLKAYDQGITQLAFASDSSVLVASDLSGYLDSWVLEGHEDLTAPEVEVGARDHEKNSIAGSDSDSDSDSTEDDDVETIFYGQHWTDNPSGHLLPKLDSTPLILTFRPTKPQPPVNGNPGIHATRHNPHAHSHELPHGQHKLLIITSKHQLYELDVLAGRLSDWSRRNPTAALPEEFKKIRDRVMGAMWDVGAGKERLWVYGASFVCMLNVGGDLGLDADVLASKKRRRKPKDGASADRGADSEEAVKRRKFESGAGGKVDPAHHLSGFAESATRVEGGQATSLALAPTRSDDEADDDEAEGVGVSLTRLRSGGDDDGQDNALARREDQTPSERRRWWCTFKYRPVLGMVPVGGGGDGGGEVDGEGKPLEVVLVERPGWEVGDDERKRRG